MSERDERGTSEEPERNRTPSERDERGTSEEPERSTALDAVSLAEAEQFLYREARLADNHEYDAWEGLWTDDAIYWVPAGGESATDPTTQVSVLFDNRSRIGTRIRQLKTGERHSQDPTSSVCRMIGNVELLGEHDGDTVVGATGIVVESRERGTTYWVGRFEYRLRRVEQDVRMSFKKVTLVDRDQPLNTLAFLI